MPKTAEVIQSFMSKLRGMNDLEFVAVGDKNEIFEIYANIPGFLGGRSLIGAISKEDKTGMWLFNFGMQHFMPIDHIRQIVQKVDEITSKITEEIE